MLMLDLNKALPNQECIFKGDKYRITVLTERLVRLEYNESGIFEDLPTQLVWYRNFEKPEFEVEESKSILKIKTKYFILEYRKNKKFNSFKLNPANNLKITLNNGSYWYYNHPEARNFKTASYKLKNDKSITYEKGLYSLNGFASIEDNSDLILQDGTFKKRVNYGIDTYVFLYDKDYYLCLNDYFKITGRPQLLPRYAFGNWWSKDQTYSEIELSKLINKFEKMNVPISILLLNDWYTNDSFNIDDFYKDPIALINYVKNKNIKIGLTIEELTTIKESNPKYTFFREYISPDKSGNLPFNVYDKNILELFFSSVIRPLNNKGIDFYNLDYFNKKEVDKLRILKHSLYCENIHLKRQLLCAYKTVAPHRYSTIYSGPSKVDFSSLKDILEFNTTAANMGVSFWTHDFGGTDSGIEDNELYIRYLQLGVFSPILKLASTKGKYYKREPWKWEIKTEKIASDYLKLRYKLIPYIYTESYKYYKYGKPLIEPIYYRYPAMYDDYNYRYNYFFGNSIYISPIIEKKNPTMDRVIHKLYIPEGIWYDLITGKKYLGNKKYISFYKDEEYPAFVQSGSIIPMSLNKFNDVSAPKNMEIHVFPGRSNTYSIYEDDGETNEYIKGEFLITNVEYIYGVNNYKLTILPVAGKNGIVPDKRNYKIVFRNTKHPEMISTYISNSQVSNNSYIEGKDFIVEVPSVPTNSQLTILCDGDSLEVDEVRIINDDIISIISDLPIPTEMKQSIDDILFSKTLDKNKKRISLRKLAYQKNPVDKKYIKLFLNLLEYIEEI